MSATGELIGDAIDRYVPALIRERLLADGAADGPTCTPLDAAVLFADIAGFTALTERLARRGADGAEEVAAFLNEYFGRFIDVVDQAGGDVLKLAGDSALAVWRAGDGAGLDACVRAAAETALRLQRLLASVNPGADTPVATRIAIGAGPLLVMNVGGVFDRREFVVAGSALRQLAVSGQGAPGRVMLSPEALATFATPIRGQTFASGALELDPGAFDHAKSAGAAISKRAVRRADSARELAILRSYLPGAVRPRLEAGQHTLLAELRTVSVLFIGLHGAADASEGDLAAFDERVRAVQAALYRYEGSLNKLSVDEKGITVVAAMGLPPFAHEDNASRAVRAARKIRDDLRALGASSAIGVASGRVFCGVIGGDQRCEYTVIGDVVNLSARLMQAAGDGILCDGPTRDGAAARFLFEALAPIRVKGKSDPVLVHAPLAPIVVATPRRPIVGRRDELVRIEMRLRDLGSGRGGVVLIEGDAGIGKSRLVAEVAPRGAELGVRVLGGAADPTERSTSYRAWRAVIAALLGLEPETAVTMDEVRAAVQGDAGDERLPLLNEVLALGLPDTDLTAEMRGEVRADNTRELLVDLLEAAVRRSPLAILLEDVHWSDSASRELLLACVRRIPALLFVVTTRPLASEAAEQDLRAIAAAASDHLRLSALDEDEAAVLVRARLGAATLADEVASVVKTRAHGNPFYSQELAQSLRDAGLIVVQDGEARAAPGVDLASAALPDSIGSVITARIDRLSPAEQTALKIASVIGRRFELELLRAVHPDADRQTLPDILTRLEEQELLSLETLDPAPTYAFRHALIVDAVYGLMLYSQRRGLHRAVAEWHEREADEATRPLALLAHHWAAAGDDTRALACLEGAGEQALRSGAYVESCSFLERALASWERGAPPLTAPGARLRRGRIERQLGEAEYGLGRNEAARDTLERALETLGARHPYAGGTPVRILAGLAQQIAHRVVRVPPAAPPRREEALEQARAWAMLGLAYYFLGDAQKFLAACLHGLNQAEIAGSSAELAAAYAQLGLMAGIVQADGLARAYLDRARATTTSVRQVTLASGMVHEWGGVHFLNRAQWDLARAEFHAAIAIFDALGDRRHWTESACALSTVTHYEAKFEERLPLGAEVYARGKDTRDLQSQAWGYLDQAESLIPLGRAAEAREMLERVTVGLRHGLTKTDAMWVQGLSALASLQVGDEAEARSQAAEAVRLMREIAPTAAYVMEGYAGATETLLELWERGDGDAKAGARAALAQFHRYALVLPLGMPRDAWCAGRFAWASGRHGAARRAWSKSLATAQRLRMPYEAARARYEIARHLEPGDPTRRRELERARSELARLRAVVDERKAVETISELRLS